MNASDHPNAQRVQAFFQAITDGDLEGAVNMYSEDTLYHVPGQIGISGTHRGRQALRDFFLGLVEMTGGDLRLTRGEALGDDGHAVMFWGLAATRPDGRSIDAKGSMAFKVNERGEFSESWFLYEDQKAYDAFWA